MADKIDAADKATIENSVKETLSWLDEHPAADQADYDNKQKALEEKCRPIITKLYQSGGMPPGAGGAGGMDDEESYGAGPSASSNQGSASGPKVEEVD